MTNASLNDISEPEPDPATQLDSEVMDALIGMMVGGGSTVAGRGDTVADRILGTLPEAAVVPGRHRTAFGIVRDMRSAGSSVDQLLVCGWVDRHGLLDSRQRSRLAVWLAELTSKAPAPFLVDDYVSMAMERYARRQVRMASVRWAELADAASLADLRASVESESRAAVSAIVRAEQVVG